MKRPYFIDINGFNDNPTLVLFQCFRKPQESSQRAARIASNGLSDTPP
jgi:hypothetical protein